MSGRGSWAYSTVGHGSLAEVDRTLLARAIFITCGRRGDGNDTGVRYEGAVEAS